MAFVDFQQGSTSNTIDPRRPQYYGSGLGDEGFVEEDEDYELLLDEALARDGLYRGMSSVISSLSIHNLIWTRQLQESIVFIHTGTFDHITIIHLSRSSSYPSLHNRNTLTLPLSSLSAFPHS